MTTDPRALAELAAATGHDLARDARPAITALTINDLYAITGALADLAATLAQTLGQLAAYLPADTDTALAADQLRHARVTANSMHTATDAAHQTLGNLAEQPETEPRGSIFNRR